MSRATGTPKAAFDGPQTRPTAFRAGLPDLAPAACLPDPGTADRDPVIGLPLFYAAVVAGSFFYGYLRLASGSVWPASIAHATHNSVSHDIEDHDSGSQHSIAQAGPTLARAWTRGDLNQIRGNWQVAGER
jgi:Type II CAAX prenyl endopeptidase Rce1-like